MFYCLIGPVLMHANLPVQPFTNPFTVASSCRFKRVRARVCVCDNRNHYEHGWLAGWLAGWRLHEHTAFCSGPTEGRGIFNQAKIPKCLKIYMGKEEKCRAYMAAVAAAAAMVGGGELALELTAVQQRARNAFTHSSSSVSSFARYSGAVLRVCTNT